MPNIQLQRTLLIGLGEIGAKTVDLFLVELAQQLGEIGMVEGLAVLTEETRLENIGTTLVIPAEAAFERWQTDFQKELETALRHISHLDHLTRLAQQGLSLRRPEEVHIIVIANLAEAWIDEALTGVTDTLRHTVYHTLACHMGLTGLLFFIPSAVEQDSRLETPTQTESITDQSDQPPTGQAQGMLPTAGWPDDRLPLDSFDRGCFLASLTNEVGLIIGDTDSLIERTVYFLTLLVKETPVGKFEWEENGAVGWGASLASFGLATIRWPGRELVDALSARWTGAMLRQLTTWPGTKEPAVDLAQQARTTAQQFMTVEKLAPPLLIERLAASMPSPPHHLAGLVPDPPWPWLLVGVQARLEGAAERWQEEWLAARHPLDTTLAELQATWPGQIQNWLKQHLARTTNGAVPVAQSYLAAVSELLAAFVEGVETQLAEVELDLAKIEQKLGQAAGTLANDLAGFPVSPLLTLLKWAPRPLSWPQRWARCHQAQATARNFAHLVRARLLALQTVWYYEELLPFYRRLQAEWKKVVATWTDTCQQVLQAAQSPELTGWADQLDNSLTASAGPWTTSLVVSLYREVIDQQANLVWEQVGTLSDWGETGLTADEIIDRLGDCTAGALSPTIAMPVDQALCRQLPDEETQTDWLEALAERGRPFWRYDETALAEQARAQVHLDRWLLLPGAEASPLAQVSQRWSRPPDLLPSPDPAEMGVVIVRHWIESRA